MIDRDVSVVSWDVSRNGGADGRYVPVTADVKAEKRRRRPQERKIDTDTVVRKRVWSDLRRWRSPWQIVDRLMAEVGDPGLQTAVGSPQGRGRTVSHEAIYAWMYAPPKREITWHGSSCTPAEPAAAPCPAGQTPRTDRGDDLDR
ncbi:hypothetical protein Kisp02_31580 [Kineosporia sp. NBRC 101731]|nr:hypothetical protein Kisp02_31580 [Kineosporia sp. NBRC 101731]